MAIDVEKQEQNEETQRRRPETPVCQQVPECRTAEQENVNHLRPRTPAAAETAVDKHWKRQNTDNESYPPTAPRDTPSASRGHNMWSLAYELNEEIQKNGADNDPQHSPDNARRGQTSGVSGRLVFHRQGTIAHKSTWGIAAVSRLLSE